MGLIYLTFRIFWHHFWYDGTIFKVNSKRYVQVLLVAEYCWMDCDTFDGPEPEAVELERCNIRGINSSLVTEVWYCCYISWKCCCWMQAAALWVLALYHPFRYLNRDLLGATNLNFRSKRSCLCSTDCHIFLYGWDCTWFWLKRMGNNGRSISRALFYFQC